MADSVVFVEKREKLTTPEPKRPKKIYKFSVNLKFAIRNAPKSVYLFVCPFACLLVRPFVRLPNCSDSHIAIGEKMVRQRSFLGQNASVNRI